MDRFTAGRHTAFFDANVLYPAELRNFIMRLTLRGLFRARWSDQVHEEWINAVLRQRPDIARSRLERTRDLMNAYAEDCLVTGFESLVEALDLPDPNDRHVLAAAIRTGAGVIVTYNLRDFPADKLEPYGLEAQHPDEFLTHLLDLSPGSAVAAAKEHRHSLKNPPFTSQEYLSLLERQELTQTVAILRNYIQVI